MEQKRYNGIKKREDVTQYNDEMSLRPPSARTVRTFQSTIDSFFTLFQKEVVNSNAYAENFWLLERNDDFQAADKE